MDEYKAVSPGGVSSQPKGNGCCQADNRGTQAAAYSRATFGALMGNQVIQNDSTSRVLSIPASYFGC